MRLASAFIVVLVAACGTEQSSTSTSLTRAPGECSDVEVHVIGVNDANGEGTTTGTGSGSDSGGSTVILKREGHHILVLSSYKATHWNVQVEGGAVLDGVYAVGYEPQTVHANVRTKINTESGMQGGATAFGYRYPSTDTAALLKLTSIRVARHATSFHGCFSASHWEIGNDMAVTSDCATTVYKKYDAVLDCDGSNTCGQDGDGDGDSGDGSGDGSLY